MKRFFVFVLLACAPLTTTFAWNNMQNLNNGTEESKYQYRSNSGVQYQYDLSNPGDQIRYSVDPAAQMRDQISVDPRRSLDEGLGQFGGGIRR